IVPPDREPAPGPRPAGPERDDVTRTVLFLAEIMAGPARRDRHRLPAVLATSSAGGNHGPDHGEYGWTQGGRRDLSEHADSGRRHACARSGAARSVQGAR